MFIFKKKEYTERKSKREYDINSLLGYFFIG